MTACLSMSVPNIRIVYEIVSLVLESHYYDTTELMTHSQ